VKPMAVNSINKNIRRLGQLFKWSVQNGYIERNIVEGMSLPETKRQDQYREVFDQEDLVKIFSSPIHKNKEYLHSYYYWLPLLGLYTGARIEELLILLSKSGHKESDEYNHFWRCSLWERSGIIIQKSIKLKQSV